MIHITERVTPTIKSKISDKIYGLILDNIVITCVDVILYTDSHIFLTTRSVFPKKGLWIIGGRMNAGESPTEAIRRKLQEETGLCIDESRFVFLNTYSQCFKTRKQQPEENGSHTLSLTFMCKLETFTEVTKISLVESEYVTGSWFPISDVERMVRGDIFLEPIINNFLNKIQI